MSDTDASRLADALLPAVLEAGRVEMRHFTGGVVIEKKADKSPVTAADREAEAIILKALLDIAPGVPVVAEEAAAAGQLPPPSSRFFLVDALDGTRLFIQGKPEFSVNIALIENCEPVFGLVYVPPTGALYVTRAASKSYFAEVMPDVTAGSLCAINYRELASRVPDRTNLLAFNSRTAGGASTDFLNALGVKEARPLGSSEKFCLIAKGEGDVYARLGETYEWDTGAGQAILEAAGGTVATLDGRRLSYGKTAQAYKNPYFVAWAGKPLITTADIKSGWVPPQPATT
jgi:3'(2'), 5'-bisphosphate nucleotidase